MLCVMYCVCSWFSRLGSLLTVNEAAEWVVHAVQLPAEVGKLFTDACISGYDFPTLLQNDGEYYCAQPVLCVAKS